MFKIVIVKDLLVIEDVLRRVLDEVSEDFNRIGGFRFENILVERD